eukprot:3645125-Rhodomonas_salina.3
MAALVEEEVECTTLETLVKQRGIATFDVFAVRAPCPRMLQSKRRNCVRAGRFGPSRGCLRVSFDVRLGASRVLREPAQHTGRVPGAKWTEIVDKCLVLFRGSGRYRGV